MKPRVAAVLTGLGVALLVFHLYALSVLVGTFAAGLAWWANLLLVLGPAVAVFSLVLCVRRPRQGIAALLNGVVVLVYLGVWVQIIPQLRFAATR